MKLHSTRRAELERLDQELEEFLGGRETWGPPSYQAAGRR
jgi:hypothetical protein